MKYQITTTSFTQQSSDCLIIPVLADKSLSPIGEELDRITEGQLSRIIQASLPSELGKTIILYEPMQLATKRILAVSCGETNTLSKVEFKKLIASITTAIKGQNIDSICCCLEDFPIEASPATKIVLAIQQFESTSYQFEKYKSQPKKLDTLASISFYNSETAPSENLEDALQKGKAISEGMHFTKDLANTPSNHATPTKVAACAQELADADPCLEVEIYDKTDETIKKMGAFLAVAQGSEEPAQFVVIKYTPTAANTQPPIVLVGKGITFDSGGISLKPSNNMGEMKFDMTGAASVLGTIKAISQLKVPVPVIGLLPLAENLPSGSALKPGDVVHTLSGQTVEVLDTDAEGRLILADALTYSRQFDPAVVIDVATLTGAVVVALGEITTGLMTANAKLRADLEAASETSADRLWALPLWDEYQELINSNVADMANLGARGAGSITAACFLSRFTKGMRWAHLDIAGTAYASGREKTATGRPVPLLVQYILDYAKQTTSE